MDRRLFTFIIASTAFFLCYMTLLRLFGPPPKDQANQAPAAAVADAGDNDSDGEQVEPKADDPPSTDPDDSVDEPEATEIQRTSQEEWFTLGSMDPASGHHLLVTLSNKGGGVERIEMTARKEDGELEYRRVDVRRGYLGYFAPSEDVDGVKVNVVGPGTPADPKGTVNFDGDGRCDEVTIAKPDFRPFDPDIESVCDPSFDYFTDFSPIEQALFDAYLAERLLLFPYLKSSSGTKMGRKRQ